MVVMQQSTNRTYDSLEFFKGVDRCNSHIHERVVWRMGFGEVKRVLTWLCCLSHPSDGFLIYGMGPIDGSDLNRLRHVNPYVTRSKQSANHYKDNGHVP